MIEKSFGSRDVWSHPIPKRGLLGERSQEDELRQGTQYLRVKTKKTLSVPSLDERCLTARHAEYRGWCPPCVVDKRKNSSMDGRLRETMRQILKRSLSGHIGNKVMKRQLLM